MAKSRDRQNHAPWWVGDNKTLFSYFDAEIKSAVDDLDMLMEWLREDKNFAQADRLRTIIGRLARLTKPYHYRPCKDAPPLIREIAKGYK